jgi:hypothetical protein
MTAQAIERSTPSHIPRSLGETEMENRLAIAHTSEAMSIAQNRVPSGADRINSLDICRHYHNPMFNLLDRTQLLISRIIGQVSFSTAYACYSSAERWVRSEILKIEKK